MGKSSSNFSKFLVYISGAIGLGILGAHLYNKKIKKYNHIKSIEKQGIKKEVDRLFEADYTFINILIHEDAELLSKQNLDSVFELKSIQYALDVYHESIDFKTPEVKNLIRLWLLKNIKVLEAYLGKASSEEVSISENKYKKTYTNFKNLLKFADLEILLQDTTVQEYKLGVLSEINKGVKNNISIARYLFCLNY